MTQQRFEEPPELKDSSGDKIVVFRRPDGTLFSNHPEYEFARAMHEQGKSAAAAESDDGDIEDDEPQEPDNGDGVKSYEEMTSHDLLALAKEREVELPDRKRSTAIKALEDWDAAQAGKTQA